MKILLLTPIYHIEGRADLFHDSSAIHYLLSPLAKKHEIRVFDTYCSSIREFLKPSGIKRLFKEKAFAYAKDGVNVDLLESRFLPKQVFFNYKQQRRVLFKLRKVVDEFRPEFIIVHFPTYYCGIIDQIKTDARIVSVLHKTDINRIKVFNHLKDYLNNSFSDIASRSKQIQIDARSSGINVGDTIISSGIDIDERGVTVRNDKVRSFLYTGKLIKRKNVDVIIQAFSKLDDPSLTLKIIGDGKEFTKLKKFASENIIFTGTMPREKVFEEMKKADVFVMPSVQETFGLVYLEAMSQGCLTIGTKGEGIDGVIINNKNGFLVSPNTDDLFKTFKKILSMPNEEIEAISNAAIETAIDNSSSKASDRYEEFITGINDSKESELDERK